jgi:beta propeller repeat protein
MEQALGHRAREAVMVDVRGRTPVRLLLSAALAASVLASPAPAATAAWLDVASPLTTYPSFKSDPEISRTKVVYADYRNANEVGDPDDPDQLFDVRVHDVITGSDKLLTPKHDAYWPAVISGNRIAWVYWRSAKPHLQIRYHNLATGTDKSLNVSGQELSIDGKRLCYGRDQRIWVYDLSTGKERAVSPKSQHAAVCDISGNKVVWQAYTVATKDDVYSYDLTKKKLTRLTHATGRESFPRISGSWVVWMDDRNGALNEDVYAYSLKTGATRPVETHAASSWMPQISGTRVVWTESTDTTSTMMLYDLASGVRTEIGSSGAWSSNPAISGNRIVWVSSDGENTQLHLRTITPPVLRASTPKKAASGTKPKVTGTLRAQGGTPIVGVTVRLEYSTNNSTWKKGAVAVTSVTGAYQVSGPKITRKYTWLRVRFAGTADWAPALSGTLKVTRK